MGITIKGLKGLRTKLDNLGGDSLAAIEKAVKQTVQAADGDAKAMRPYSSIAIQTETKRTATGVEGRVFSNTPYAAYVEFGTGPKGQADHSGISPNVGVSYTQHPWVYPTEDGEFRRTSGQPAKPFLYPAAKQNEDLFPENIRHEIVRALRAIAGRG